MSGLTKEFLEQMGIELDQPMFDELSQHFDTTLYNNVTRRITKTLDAEKAQELSALNQSDKAQVWDWILNNVPDLEYIIQEEVYMLIGDVIEHADHI